MQRRPAAVSVAGALVGLLFGASALSAPALVLAQPAGAASAPTATASASTGKGVTAPAGNPAPGAASEAEADSGEGDLLRTIGVGDTLDKLARRELDSPERWRDVAAYNNIANPRRISPGTVVRVKREWLRNEQVRARIEAVGGKALVNGRPAQPGDTVPEGASFETHGEDTVVLSLPDGTQLRIAPDSRVRLERLRAYHSDRAIEALIQLERGGVEPVSPPKRPRPLEIRTPAGNAAVRGTHFRVRAEPKDGFIEVLTGAVAAGSAAGDATVDASKGAVVSPVKAPLVETLLPAPYLVNQWPLPQRMPRFDLPLPMVAGAAGYRVEVARDAAFVDILRSQVVSGPVAEVASERDGPLHVRVRAVSAAGIEGFDSVATIMVAARPVPPTLAGRTDPEDPLEGPVTLSWTPTDASGQRYVVQLAADAAFDSLIGETVVTTPSATLDLPPIRQPATRYWRVAAVDGSTGHRGPYSAAHALAQRAPATIERAVPVPIWRDSSGQPLRGGFGGQVLPGY